MIIFWYIPKEKWNREVDSEQEIEKWIFLVFSIAGLYCLASSLYNVKGTMSTAQIQEFTQGDARFLKVRIIQKRETREIFHFFLK